MTAAGLFWAFWPAQDADASFVPVVRAPAFDGRGPRVVIDEAHANVHAYRGRYRPFARLLIEDGFAVRPGRQTLSRQALATTQVLVIANPLGGRGLFNQAMQRLRLERLVQLRGGALSGAEIAVVERWVRDGGALLLAADHAPAAQAAQPLARAFGVEMTGWWAEDPAQPDPGSPNPAFIRFSRAAGSVLDHPITNGRSPDERIDEVLTFTGQALRAPDHAAVILRLSSSAREYPYRRSAEREGRTAAGLAQAVALAHGRGRVFVIGEAAALTAQTAPLPGGGVLRLGINRADADNQQFVLNIVHWLAELR